MPLNRLAHLKELLKAQPEDVFLQYALAMEYLGQDELEEGLKRLQQLRETHPGYLPVYYQLGKAHEAKGEWQQAVDTYQAGIPVAKEQGDQKTMNELRQAAEWAEEELE